MHAVALFLFAQLYIRQAQRPEAMEVWPTASGSPAGSEDASMLTAAATPSGLLQDPATPNSPARSNSSTSSQGSQRHHHPSGGHHHSGHACCKTLRTAACCTKNWVSHFGCVTRIESETLHCGRFQGALIGEEVTGCSLQCSPIPATKEQPPRTARVAGASAAACSPHAWLHRPHAATHTRSAVLGSQQVVPIPDRLQL